MERKAIIAGAGGMGNAWARTLTQNPNTTVVGWVDILPERAAKSIEELALSDVAVGDNLSKMIEEVKADFVLDATIPEAHCDVTVTALGKGLHVLGEKPMASSMEEAKRMVKAAEDSGKLYMVSQSRRYDPLIVAYKKLVGRLGPIGILNADFYIGAHFGGFRDEMPSPLVLDMAIHTYDAARYVTDADPVAVYCDEFNPSWSWYTGDACANAIFEMSNGLRFCYRGSWCAEGRHTSWESEWRAVGPQGTATWDGMNGLHADLIKKRNGFHSEMESVSQAPDDNTPKGIAGALVDFLYALDHGTKPMGECRDNIKSLAMVFGAMESSRKGCKVEIKV